MARLLHDAHFVKPPFFAHCASPVRACLQRAYLNGINAIVPKLPAIHLEGALNIAVN